MLTLKEFFKDQYIDLSDAEILEEVIEEKLPGWKRSCEYTDADLVILDQGAFGESVNEMLLLGMAVKYAGKHGKNIAISSKRATIRS